MAKSAAKNLPRKPRVHIEYEVEAYGSQQKVSLPFVMGVMADLSGNPKDALPSITDRKFINIDSENFDQVMEKAGTRFSGQVKNTLTKEGGNLSVDMTFKSMEDFSPAGVIQGCQPLKELMEVRTKLDTLFANLDGKDKLIKSVEDILQDTVKKLSSSSQSTSDSKEK